MTSFFFRDDKFFLLGWQKFSVGMTILFLRRRREKKPKKSKEGKSKEGKSKEGKSKG
jgi:hypothetical protein